MKIHHFGYVVSNIDNFSSKMVCGQQVERVFDPIQNAELALFDNGNIYIELIEPKGTNAFTYQFLQESGQGFHHLCYEVSSIESALEIITKKRMIKVLGPVPAVLFDGKEVVFAYNRNKEIVEFLIC